ncbi:MAG: hypothetical protein ABSG44_09960 [Thermodesulfobacteriota bacterium]
MNIERAKAKLDKIHSNKSRRDRFLQHLDNQEARLSRIAELLEVSPDEAQELIELILEFSTSARRINPKMIRGKKRISSGPSPEDYQGILRYR